MTNRAEVYITVFNEDGDVATWWLNADGVTLEESFDRREPFTATIKAEEYKLIDFSHGGNA